jgi:hypothetical protein
MATIINTLEVVIEQPKTPGPAELPLAPNAPPQFAPRDLSDILQRQSRQAARLRAH